MQVKKGIILFVLIVVSSTLLSVKHSAFSYPAKAGLTSCTLYADKSSKPIAGKNFTLTYSPETKGIFKKPQSLKLVYVFDFWGRHTENALAFWTDVEDTANPRRLVTAMNKKGNVWIVTIPIPKEAQLLSYYITDGQKVDNNEKRTYLLPIYGDDGKPVRGAYYRIIDFVRLTGGSTDAQMTAAKKEIEFYPDNYSAYFPYWRLWYTKSRGSQAVRDSIMQSLDLLLARDPENLELMNVAASTYFYVVREFEKALEMKNKIPQDKLSPMAAAIYDVKKAEEEAKKIREEAEKKRQTLLNNPAPNFRLKSLAGDSVSLSDFQGNVVLVSFWVTGAGPCRTLMPRLQFLFDANKGNRFVLLALSLDRKKEDVRPFVAARELTFTVLYADEQVAKEYGVVSLPTTFILDKRGNVRRIHLGFVRGREQEWLQEIHELLKEP